MTGRFQQPELLTSGGLSAIWAGPRARPFHALRHCTQFGGDRHPPPPYQRLNPVSGHLLQTGVAFQLPRQG